MSEMLNFVHSLARSKWREVTPEWALVEVDQGTREYQYVEQVQTSYNWMGNEEEPPAWAPLLYSPVSVQIERFAGMDSDDEMRNVFIGQTPKSRILYYWIEPLKNVIEWGGYKWQKYPPNYGGMRIDYGDRQGVVVGYNAKLHHYLVEWLDSGGYIMASESFLRLSLPR